MAKYLLLDIICVVEATDEIEKLIILKLEDLISRR